MSAPVSPEDAAQVNRGAIERTERLIRPYVRRTPVMQVEAADFALEGAPISFKLELTQHAGSFKPRGAFSNLLQRDGAEAGVVAASGGNHGAAVAFAGRRLGLPATIFVPSVSSPAKQALIRDLGADLRVGGALYAEALAAAEAFAEQTGAMRIHAYDQVETLLGQGTVGLEIEQQLGDQVDTVLVAVGGGGLIGGVAAALERRFKVVAVEPETAPTLHAAMAAGAPVDAPAGGVAADSLAPKRIGALPFAIVRDRIAPQVVLAPDAAIVRAQAELWRRLRLATEPGGAAAFAALLSGRYRPEQGERVCVLLCGGNTDAVSFAAEAPGG